MIVFGCAAVREPVLLLRAGCAEAWGNCRLVREQSYNYDRDYRHEKRRVNSNFFHGVDCSVETLGGFEGRRIRFQELIGVGQFENAINHAGSAGEAKQAARSLKTGKTIDKFSEAAAIEFGNIRKINDDMPVIIAKQLIEGELQLLAFDAHLQGAAQLEDYDAGLQLFLVDQQRNLPFVCKILKQKAATFH